MLKGRIPNPSPFLKVPPLKRTLKSPSSPHIVYPFIYGSIFTPISKHPYEVKFSKCSKIFQHFFTSWLHFGCIHHFSTAMFCSMSRFCWKIKHVTTTQALRFAPFPFPTKGTDHQFNGEDHRIAVTNHLRGGRVRAGPRAGPRSMI